MVHSKAEDRLLEKMFSGKEPIIVTQSKENVVDSSEEIAERQRLADAERELASALRAHTPTTDEANKSTSNPTLVDALGRGR